MYSVPYNCDVCWLAHVVSHIMSMGGMDRERSGFSPRDVPRHGSWSSIAVPVLCTVRSK
jgi:hypothetical protein